MPRKVTKSIDVLNFIRSYWKDDGLQMSCLLNFVDYTGDSCFDGEELFEVKVDENLPSDFNVIRDIKSLGYDFNEK